MDFYEVLDDVLEWLLSRGRVTYRALKRQFNVDDEFLEDLKEEIIYGQKLAVDEDDRVLLWTGDINAASTPTPVPSQPEVATPTTTPERAPSSYTPSYLAEKILTGKTSLEGERKVVTVLFADIKDATELIRDLDPEDAQKLLDPAIHLMMESVHRFEGTVHQVLGDGIMSLFGAPMSHEDHAARACYAALAMQAAMRDTEVLAFYTLEEHPGLLASYNIDPGVASSSVWPVSCGIWAILTRPYSKASRA
jgi:hypothetical protein